MSNDILMSEELDIVDNNKNKYTIYPNTDFKYKKFRQLDLNNIVKNNPVLRDLLDEGNDKDTLEYRLKENKVSKKILDLSHLNLTKLENLNINYSNIFELYISDNSILNLKSLTNFTNLKILDVANNNLINLPK